MALVGGPHGTAVRDATASGGAHATPRTARRPSPHAGVLSCVLFGQDERTGAEQGPVVPGFPGRCARSFPVGSTGSRDGGSSIGHGSRHAAGRTAGRLRGGMRRARITQASQLRGLYPAGGAGGDAGSSSGRCGGIRGRPGQGGAAGPGAVRRVAIRRGREASGGKGTLVPGSSGGEGPADGPADTERGRGAGEPHSGGGVLRGPVGSGPRLLGGRTAGVGSPGPGREPAGMDI